MDRKFYITLARRVLSGDLGTELGRGVVACSWSPG